MNFLVSWKDAEGKILREQKFAASGWVTIFDELGGPANVSTPEGTAQVDVVEIVPEQT